MHSERRLRRLARRDKTRNERVMNEKHTDNTQTSHQHHSINTTSADEVKDGSDDINPEYAHRMVVNESSDTPSSPTSNNKKGWLSMISQRLQRTKRLSREQV